MVGGVCGGLAEYTGIDPLLWRGGFVALAFAGGSGILVYLLLWLLMPADGPDPAPGAGAAARPVGRRPREPRSPVPRVTIAGLLIVVGALVLLTRFTGWDVGPRGFLGAALLVVGLGLVAAAFAGGRRAKGGLITLGVLLTAALIAASAFPWHSVRDGVGNRTYRPVTAAQVQPFYRAGVGDMTLDLTRIDVSHLAAPITTRLQHGVGDLQIVLPGDADVQLTVHSGLGSVDAFGQGSVNSGFFPGQGSGSWVDDGHAEFDLQIDSGIGDVEVLRG